MDYNAGTGEIKERIFNVRSSLGKGFLGNLNLGYEHNEHISTSLNISYLKGRETGSESVTGFYPIGDEVIKSGIRGRFLSFSPTFTFSYEIKDFKPYLSVGIPISFISFKETLNYKSPNNKIKEELIRQYTGSYSLGVTTRLGFLVKLNPTLSIFSEVSFTYSSFSPDNSKVTKYEVNKIDSLSSLNVSELSSEYSEENRQNYEYVDDEWVEVYDVNKPRRLRKIDIPVSHFSFTLGVRFYPFRKDIEQSNKIKSQKQNNKEIRLR